MFVSNDNYGVQYSPKTPSGSLLNLRGDNVPALVEKLEELLNGPLMQLVSQADAAIAAGGVLGAAGVLPQRAAPQQAEPSWQHRPQAVPSPAPSGPPAPQCKHGVMTRREGTSAKGPWVGYFCGLAKGDPDQCKAQFSNAA